jgi:chromosome segregation protein
MIGVTHNKRTMEMADRIYGVTMSEPGVSTIISTELTPAEVALA